MHRTRQQRLLALPSTPSGPTTPTTLPTVADSDVVVGPRLGNRARSSRGRSASPAVRDSSVGEARRREPAVVCQQPPVGGSTQFGGRRQSRPRGAGATIGTVARRSCRCWPAGDRIRPLYRWELARSQQAPGPPLAGNQRPDRSVATARPPTTRPVSQLAKTRTLAFAATGPLARSMRGRGSVTG